MLLEVQAPHIDHLFEHERDHRLAESSGGQAVEALHGIVIEFGVAFYQLAGDLNDEQRLIQHIVNFFDVLHLLFVQGQQFLHGSNA